MELAAFPNVYLVSQTHVVFRVRLGSGAENEAPVAWFVQGKETVHIVCMRSPTNGWPVPKCKEECERAFKLAPTLEGSGPLPVGLTICGSCRRRMPSAALTD